MCLGIPMQIRSIDGYTGRCAARGVEREVNLFLLQHEELAPGDHVVVHVGYAIQKMAANEAASFWDTLDQALAAEAGAPAED